jgi:hypothetical protein
VTSRAGGSRFAAARSRRRPAGVTATGPSVTANNNRPQPSWPLRVRRLGWFRMGRLIILDGGTTTLLVAQNLPRDLRAIILTNSPLWRLPWLNIRR